MIISFTGSRPNKIGGYQLPNDTYNYVCQETEKILLKFKPDKVISGMCIGYDQYAAFIALKLNIPLIAAVPFKGQELAWPQKSQEVYNKLIKRASEVVIVSNGGYSAHKMQIRNEWMVNNCDKLLACYNGDKTGGTANCINYAKGIGKEIVYINPNNAKKAVD